MFLSLLTYIFRWITYGTSFLIPKNKKLWIFIGWRYSAEREIFSENTKYLFLHVANDNYDIRPIWIGGDIKICEILNKKGYEAYPLYSLKGAWYSLRAKYTIISAMLPAKNWKYSGGSKIIQLWHGKSLKKTGFQSPYSLTKKTRLRSPNLFVKFFRFIAISEYFSQYVVDDFHIPKAKILTTGLPKHDALLHRVKDGDIDVDTELDNLLEKVRAQGARRIMLYGPTFRPDGSNPLLQIDLEKLNTVLQKNNDHVVISLHPKFATIDWIPEKSLPHIHFCQGDYDRYPILHKFDVLITDYSSLSIDFLLMGKPVILFAYDIEKYKKEMGIYDELWETMPGPKVYTFSELCEVLTEDLTPYNAKIPTAQAKLFDATDGKSSERIVRAILDA